MFPTINSLAQTFILGYRVYFKSERVSMQCHAMNNEVFNNFINSATAASVIGTLLKNSQFDCSSYPLINCLSNFSPHPGSSAGGEHGGQRPHPGPDSLPEQRDRGDLRGLRLHRHQPGRDHQLQRDGDQCPR